MTEPDDEVAGVPPRRERSGPGRGRSRTATALFAVGLCVVAANSALYFFGADSLSHPAASILGLALLVPLYLDEW